MTTHRSAPSDLVSATVHGIRVRGCTTLVPAIHGERLATHYFDLNYAASALETVSPPGELCARQVYSGVVEYEFRRADQKWFIWFPGFCSGVVDLERHTISMRAASPEDVSLVLPNTILSALLGPLSDLVLHASAVRWNGCTYAFCGTSGSGKSTLAAASSLAGAALVTDDALRVDAQGKDRPLCYPGVPELRLRQLRDWPLPPAQLHTLPDDRVGFRPPVVVNDLTELRGLVFPVVTLDESPPRLQRLRGERLVQRLLSATRIAWTPNVAPPVLKKLAGLAHRVPTYELHVGQSHLDRPSHHPRLLELIDSQVGRTP